MNIPAISKQSYDSLCADKEHMEIVLKLIDQLASITNSVNRVRLVHEVVDEYSREIFELPIVQNMSPCKQGCSACCHTQVSVTQDEAELLITHIEKGLKIDFDRLDAQAVARNFSEEFYKLSFEQRACVFLDSNGSCSVYEDRPSVCRTNAVIGDSSQCDTSKGLPRSQRLVRTSKADMAIYAHYKTSSSNGALPFMIKKMLKNR